ncbi:hypothetical protein KI387_044068, partial [Taxus chinensis]
IGVPGGPDKFISKYQDEDPFPMKRFGKYTCDTMTTAHKACLENILIDAFKEEWRIPKKYPAIIDGEVDF